MFDHVLRDATNSDYDFLWHVTKATMHDYVEAIWGWDEEWQLRHFHDNFFASRWRIIVVEGQDAGGLQAYFRQTDGDLFLANIYLLPEFQRQGIGSAVVRRLMEEARTLRLPLALNVLRSNPDARRLYERLGLRVVKETEQRFFMSTGGNCE